ncbi:Hypothetical protein R9X50_00798000 [Acrodontium crateriforme]|uniref:Uncharacterized protein n=1 Tax=Acrodontium crateriforme TaxID=150365 RepID=A0AAQ3MDD6_9PEZI|nr:Hypothetical protein R9X50_00798000 [Acrodontium crateriforme]
MVQDIKSILETSPRSSSVSSRDQLPAYTESSQNQSKYTLVEKPKEQTEESQKQTVRSTQGSKRAFLKELFAPNPELTELKYGVQGRSTRLM